MTQYYCYYGNSIFLVAGYILIEMMITSLSFINIFALILISINIFILSINHINSLCYRITKQDYQTKLLDEFNILIFRH